MDPTAFDTLARAIAQTGTRRWLMLRLAAVPLVGVLAVADAEDGGAERPHERLGRRTQQRNRKQRNNKKKNKHQDKRHKGKGKGKGKDKGKGNNGGNRNPSPPPDGGLRDPAPCTPTGQACTQSGDCCSSTCFNFVCATPVTQCGEGNNATPCDPPAAGCCPNQPCCTSPTNQCNDAGLCCAPNCTGRQCGEDGCGNSGTCGSCVPGQTCSASGQCQGQPSCGPQSCAGCCDDTALCQPGDTPQVCGTGGGSCATCTGQEQCQNGQCRCVPSCQGKECGSDGCGGSCSSCPPGQTCTAQGQCLCTAESCPTGCCTLGPGSPGLCLPGDTPQNCGSGGQLCFSCPRGQTCEDHGFCACRPDHCSGCCLGGPDGTCQPGTTPQACGTGGRTCTACGSGQACCGGVCCGGTTGTICCDGVCVTGNCCSVGDCGSAGNACTNHTCTCGGGPACSGDNPDCCQRPLGLGFECTNINSDPNNCGVCGAACDFGLICCNRACC